jgi:hypothetical protein
MEDDMADTHAHSDDRFQQLKSAKADRLRELMQRRPGEKHYKRALRDYLEADGQFVKLLVKRSGLH